MTAQPLREPARFELQAGQRLPELVVDLPGDAGLLLLPHGLQMRRERLEVVIRGLELGGAFDHAALEILVHPPDLFFRALAGGDVEGHHHTSMIVPPFFRCRHTPASTSSGCGEDACSSRLGTSSETWRSASVKPRNSSRA